MGMAVDSAARVVADIAAAGGQAVAAQFDLTEEAAVVAGIAEKRWSGRRSWASELGPENITVNFVAPGWIPVERHRNVAASDMAQYPGQVPLGRQGPPAELAAMVVFLASPRADFITGQTFAVTAAAPSPERQPFAQQSPGLAEPVPSVTESIVPQASPAIVYASHSPSSEIVALTLDSENGSLRELSRIVVPHEGPQETGSLQLALARRSRRLYAALPAAPFVLASFRIELPSAELRLLGTTTLPRHSGHLTLDAAERRLFSVSYSGHLLTVSPVGPGGEAGSPIVAMTTSLNPHGVVAHPGNGLLYVGAMRGNRISAFRLSDDGTLVPRPEAGALPRPSVGPNSSFSMPAAADSICSTNMMRRSTSLRSSRRMAGCGRCKASASCRPTSRLPGARCRRHGPASGRATSSCHQTGASCSPAIAPPIR